MSVPLIKDDSALKFGTVIVGGLRVEVSIAGKTIIDDSVPLNLTSTYSLSTNCFQDFGGFLTLESSKTQVTH
jgi:hypothetical protein